jgi:hypothetical protein
MCQVINRRLIGAHGSMCIAVKAADADLKMKRIIAASFTGPHHQACHFKTKNLAASHTVFVYYL